MSDTVSCPTCLRESVDAPLAFDINSGDFVCAQFHHFSPEEVGGMLEAMPPPEPPQQRKRAGRHESQKRDRHGESQKQDNATAVSSRQRDKTAPVEEAKAASGEPVAVAANCNDLGTESATEPKPVRMTLEPRDIPPVEPDGDCFVTIKIREAYVQTLQDLARESNQFLTQLVQERVDWWMENEYTLAGHKG